MVVASESCNKVIKENAAWTTNPCYSTRTIWYDRDSKKEDNEILHVQFGKIEIERKRNKNVHFLW